MNHWNQISAQLSFANNLYNFVSQINKFFFSNTQRDLFMTAEKMQVIARRGGKEKQSLNQGKISIILETAIRMNKLSWSRYY